MLQNLVYFGNSIDAWLTAAAVATFVFVALKLTRRILIRRLGAIAATSETIVDDLVVDTLRRTRTLFIAAAALYFGSGVLDLPEGTRGGIRTTMIVLLLVQSGIWGNAMIGLLLDRTVSRQHDTDPGQATTISGLGLVAKIAFFSIVLLVGLDNLGVNVTGLVAGLGIGGIAVALALQNVLGDLFASLSIALDKPFVIGDFVVVGDQRGTVERVGLKTTRVRSLSGEQLVFSNADLLASRIQNFKRMDERRALFAVGVTYQTPRQLLASIPGLLRDAVETQSGVRFDRAHFKSYGDFALIFEVVYFVLSPEYNRFMDVQEAINLEIHSRFESRGIEFAYPTQTLFVHAAGGGSAAAEAGFRTEHAGIHS